MKNTDLREQIAAAILANDKATLKLLKEQLGRHKWLEQWKANGSKMIDWLEPNPYIKFVDTTIITE